MKKYIFPIIAIVLGCSSCDSFLEKTPKDRLVPGTYFKTENDLKMFSNSFYENLFDKTPYDEQSDVMFEKGTISDELLGGTARDVQKAAASAGWSWGPTPKANQLLGCPP